MCYKLNSLVNKSHKIKVKSDGGSIIWENMSIVLQVAKGHNRRNIFQNLCFGYQDIILATHDKIFYILLT